MAGFLEDSVLIINHEVLFVFSRRDVCGVKGVSFS